MLKRLALGSLVSIVLVLVLALPASASSQFTDISTSPYQNAITSLSSLGIVSGYGDTFKPDNPLMRQQFAKMASLAMGYTITTANVSTFKDTPAASATDPLYPGSYVAVTSKNHIIEGYPDNTFRFYNNLTRQQMITIAVRAAGSALTTPPEDWDAGVLNYSDPTHGQNIKKAEYNGLLVGIPDLPLWDTTKNATRGETAQVLSQLLTKVVVLEVGGLSGTKKLSMAELKALPATEGYGGWKNRIGNITAPALYKGVTIGSLIALVGGGTSITVSASDGYKQPLSASQLSGDVTMYNPATGATITDIDGQLAVIVAYSENGQAIASDVGPLRLAFVSPTADQVTDGSLWVKLINGLEAK